METNTKLILAIAIAAGLGGALYMQKQSSQQLVDNHSLEAAASKMPKLDLTEERLKGADTIMIQRPATKAEGDKPGKEALSHTLQKVGEEWQLSAPVTAKANATNVKSLLDNLPKLKLTEEVSAGKDDYARWKVGSEDAVRVTVKKGQEVLFDGYFGDSGSRGQMTRIEGTDGVYTVKGYSSFLYDRETKDWRDKTIFKLEEKDVVKVAISNPRGNFLFEKSGEEWTGKYGKDSASGAIEKFQSSKVTDMVRAFKALNAVDFGDGMTPEQTGLDKVDGKITLTLANGESRELTVGAEQTGSKRWATTSGSEQVFGVSAWVAGWLTAEPVKFQEGEKKPEGAGEAGDPGEIDPHGAMGAHGGMPMPDMAPGEGEP